MQMQLWIHCMHMRNLPIMQNNSYITNAEVLKFVCLFVVDIFIRINNPVLVKFYMSVDEICENALSIKIWQV